MLVPSRLKRVAGRDDQADDRALGAGALQLLHQRRQRGFRRRGAEDEQQLLLEVADQLEDREAVPPGDGAEHDEHEEQGGQVEGADQHREVDHRGDAVLADGEGHRAEGADRGRLHQDLDQLEDRVGQRLQEVRAPGAPRSPTAASAMPNRIEKNSTCRMLPSAKAPTTVVGMMSSRKPTIVVSCALAA